MPTINNDKSFYYKALILSAFVFLAIKSFITVYRYYAIFSPSLSLNRYSGLQLFCWTNRCNSDFSLIKK